MRVCVQFLSRRAKQVSDLLFCNLNLADLFRKIYICMHIEIILAYNQKKEPDFSENSFFFFKTAFECRLLKLCNIIFMCLI